METMKIGREAEEPKAGKHKLEHMRITPGAKGGAMVRHEFKASLTHSTVHGIGREQAVPEEHPFSPGDEHAMMNHIGKHLGVKGSWGGEAYGEHENEDEDV